VRAEVTVLRPHQPIGGPSDLPCPPWKHGILLRFLTSRLQVRCQVRQDHVDAKPYACLNAQTLVKRGKRSDVPGHVFRAVPQAPPVYLPQSGSLKSACLIVPQVATLSQLNVCIRYDR
jgi:hypothetical protein